jgi:RimJ/RimL family protein N-acetyltransferase
MLTVGFEQIGLESISTWTVETNFAAQKLIARLPFRFIGRLRRCHWINGRAYDRLLFDMLAPEHREI